MKVGENSTSSKRKVRRDKKCQIKASTDIRLRESVFSLSIITTTPVKDICVVLIENSIASDEILESLSTFLKRDIMIRNVLYKGNLNNEKLYDVTDGNGQRVSFTVTQDLYEKLYLLAFGFDCSLSKISAVLIYESITHTEFIESYIESYLSSLNESRQNELRQLLKYINKENKGARPISLTDLLIYLVEQPLRWMLPDK